MQNEQQRFNDLVETHFGLVYKGRGHMNDPKSYGHIYTRLNYEEYIQAVDNHNGATNGHMNGQSRPDPGSPASV